MTSRRVTGGEDGFVPVKLICGLIAAATPVFETARTHLSHLYGVVDEQSPAFPFDFTDYYEKQMGKNLKRMFLSFRDLVSPVKISEIKHRTNALEAQIAEEVEGVRRVVNIDPGYLSASALIMATTKDFAHRVPLERGIYAHLECLFGKNCVRLLDWTYPDFKSPGYQEFLLRVRRRYLEQLR